MTVLSEAETKLIKSFKSSGLDLDWMIDVVEKGKITAPNAWKQVALEIFVAGLRNSDLTSSLSADAVRRVVKAGWRVDPLRKTTEFDELCRFE